MISSMTFPSPLLTVAPSGSLPAVVVVPNWRSEIPQATVLELYEDGDGRPVFSLTEIWKPRISWRPVAGRETTEADK
jgi:hypothetical protein